MTSHLRVDGPFSDLFRTLDDRSFALLAVHQDPIRAVVFVHGFTGHPARAWRDFDRPIAADDWWEASDLFFFGYPSTTEEIGLTVDHLITFLADVLPRRSADVAGLVGSDPPDAGYEHLVLVGHSQGGLVVRDAVLNALWEVTRPDEPSNEWAGDATLDLIANAKLRLFAPAIFGARVSGLRGMVLRSVGVGTLARTILAGSSSYHELQPGSALIARVQEQTTRRAASHPGAGALRARIAWAAKDSVVLPGGQYDFDPRSVRIDGTDHGSVCKAAVDTAPQVSLVTDAD